MYSHFGTQRVSAASGVPDVTIYAAKREDGSLTIMVINLTDSEQPVTLQVRGSKPSKAETWLFDAHHNAEDLGKLAFPSDGRLVLPAQSITLYAILK
jgi:alpha-L-arabinofuranosidase